jgi:hypothetical protein
MVFAVDMISPERPPWIYSAIPQPSLRSVRDLGITLPSPSFFPRIHEDSRENKWGESRILRVEILYFDGGWMRVSGGHTKIQNSGLEDSPAWFQHQADAISAP